VEGRTPRLAIPQQSQGGHIIMSGGNFHEFLRRGENILAEIRGGFQPCTLQGLPHTIESEFLALKLGLDNSPGDDQKHRARYQGAGRGAVRGMREQAKGHSRRLKLCDAGSVMEESRRVSRTGIANRSQILVVAAQKCGTAANPSGSIENRNIHLMTKRHDRFRFVEIFSGKQFGRKLPESRLCGNQDFAGVLSPPRQIEQAEQYSGRTDPQEFVKVAGHSQVVVQGSNFRAA